MSPLQSSKPSARLLQVAEETDALAAGLQRFTHRQQRRHAEERQRQELLERRHGGGGPLGGGELVWGMRGRVGGTRVSWGRGQSMPVWELWRGSDG